MRIVMFGASMRQWGKMNPNCLFEDLPSPAGSEMAMIGVARELAKRGHHVKVFTDCEAGVYDGVEYFRPELGLPILTQVEHDVVVSWGDASPFLYPIKAKLRVLMSQGAHLNLGSAAENVDRYFSISRFSAKTLLDSDPYADPKKMWVTRNGVYLSRFQWEGLVDAEAHEVVYEPPKVREVRDRHHLVWASSPDRGLHHLVDIFPLVKEAVPDARLTVCYDFDRAFNSYHAMLPGSAFVRWLEKAAELKKMDGVEVVQHISQPKLAGLLLSAGILAYPCDPIRETETYCVTVNEAMAAGMPVILSDADCLPENYGGHSAVLNRPIDTRLWADTITQMMLDEKVYNHQSQKSIELASHTDVSTIAKDWESLFYAYLEGKEETVDMSLASILGR